MKLAKHTLVVDHRLHIPKELIPLKVVKSRYQIDLFDDKMCNKCENKPDRPNDLCEPCDGFEASYKLYQNEPNTWSVPQGDFLAVKRMLEKRGIDFDVRDKRKAVPFDNPIKFTGKLFGANAIDANGVKRVNQIPLVKSWWKHKDGMLQAKPRAGKTVIAVCLSAHLGQKTVILADRKELLKQFYKAYMGDPVKNRPAMTNIPALQERTGREIIRIAQTAKDLKNLDDVDILLVNYQKFVRIPKTLGALINGKFSFIVVDEAHGSGATGYLRVISAANVRHRLSLTATPRRKDRRHELIHRIMGPVVAKSDSASLIPEVLLKVSEVRAKRPYKSWTHAIGWLSNCHEAHVELVKEIFRDLRDGHKVIIVPLDRKSHIDKVAQMVNHQAQKNRAKGEKWPKELAIKFYDGVDRDSVIEQVDKPGATVLFAIRSMIKQGIDFDRPSMIYVYIPMSASHDKNIGAPMLEQLGNRVCTPYPKPAPKIKIWFHAGISFFGNSITGLAYREIYNNAYDGRTGKYRVSKQFREALREAGAKVASGKKAKSRADLSWAA